MWSLGDELILERLGRRRGRVMANRITLNKPEDQNVTLAKAVAANGTDAPENDIHRVTVMGNTVIVYTAG